MDRIIVPKLNMEHIFDDKNAMYGLKHSAESGFNLQGIWQCDQYRKGELISGGYPEPPNIFTTLGRARILNVMFFTLGKTAAIGYYVGIFKNDITPAEADTAAKLGSGNAYGACQATTDFDETVYEPYTVVTTTTAGCTNAASKAEYTLAGSITVYGAFLTSDSSTTSVAGLLMSAKRFTASRAVIADDVLSISYVISLTSS